MDYKERYEKVCFSLEAAKSKLELIPIDIFTLNSEVDNLTREIKKLTNEKVELEFKLGVKNSEDE